MACLMVVHAHADVVLHLQAGLKGDSRAFNVTECLSEITAGLGDLESRWREHWQPRLRKRGRDRQEREEGSRMRKIERDSADRVKARVCGLLPWSKTVTYLPENPADVVAMPQSVADRLAQACPVVREDPLPPELKRRGLVRRVAAGPSTAANTAPG